MYELVRILDAEAPVMIKTQDRMIPLISVLTLVACSTAVAAFVDLQGQHCCGSLIDS